MASKCRTWDNDYFIEVHASKKPEETPVIEPLGEGRGRRPLKDLGSLSLPKVALKVPDAKPTNVDHESSLPASVVGRGRGQQLKERALSNLTRARRPGERTLRTTQSIHSLDHFPPLPSRPAVQNSSQDIQHGSLSSDDQPSFSKVCKSAATKSTKENVFTDSDGNAVIKIQNLPPSMTEEELLELLSPYGDVTRCCIERDGNSGSLGTAIVRMESHTACEWIVNCYNGYEYPGSPDKLVCKFITYS